VKTDDLIAMLATGTPAADTDSYRRRYVTALGWGAFGTLLLMTLWLGVRRDIAAAALLPMFWIKLAFPAALLAGALLAALRLSRPGVTLARVSLALAAPVLAMWLLAAVVLLTAAPEARGYLIFGVSWSVCPFYIAALSVPAFAAALWAMRGLAPTRLVAAGAASGLLAGAMGALAYALYCPEMAAPFIGLWYLAGMLIPAIVGAVLGPWLLRW
jgi:hypothetical protein